MYFIGDLQLKVHPIQKYLCYCLNVITGLHRMSPSLLTDQSKRKNSVKVRLTYSMKYIYKKTVLLQTDLSEYFQIFKSIQ